MTQYQPLPLDDPRPWVVVREGAPLAMSIFKRHYSYSPRRVPPTRMGPGEKIVLVSPAGDALFLWRREAFRRDGQAGANCAIFRNEGPARSSVLIQAAEQFAWKKWPGSRLFTYVKPDAIRSTNPGYCFQMAGWRKCGRSKAGLVLLEKLP